MLDTCKGKQTFDQNPVFQALLQFVNCKAKYNCLDCIYTDYTDQIFLRDYTLQIIYYMSFFMNYIL